MLYLWHIDAALVVILDRTRTAFSFCVQGVRREEIGEKSIIGCRHSFRSLISNGPVVAVVVVNVVVAVVRTSIIFGFEAKTFVAECEHTN